MTVGERIVRLRDEKGLSQYALAKAMGFQNQSQLAKVEKGSTLNPGADFLSRAARALGVSVDRLLHDEELPPAPDAGLDHDAARPEIMVLLPMKGVSSGGTPIESEDLDEPYPVVRHLAKHGRYVVRLDGDSMFPDIRHGDLFLVEPTTRVKEGEIALVKVGEGTTVKRFFRRRDGGATLKGVNPVYPPIEVEPGKWQVIGRFLTIVEGKR